MTTIDWRSFKRNVSNGGSLYQFVYEPESGYTIEFWQSDKNPSPHSLIITDNYLHQFIGFQRYHGQTSYEILFEQGDSRFTLPDWAVKYMTFFFEGHSLLNVGPRGAERHFIRKEDDDGA